MQWQSSNRWGKNPHLPVPLVQQMMPDRGIVYDSNHIRDRWRSKRPGETVDRELKLVVTETGCLYRVRCAPGAAMEASG
jgi:hypothetical protein